MPFRKRPETSPQQPRKNAAASRPNAGSPCYQTPDLVQRAGTVLQSVTPATTDRIAVARLEEHPLPDGHPPRCRRPPGRSIRLHPTDRTEAQGRWPIRPAASRRRRQPLNARRLADRQEACGEHEHAAEPVGKPSARQPATLRRRCFNAVAVLFTSGVSGGRVDGTRLSNGGVN